MKRFATLLLLGACASLLTGCNTLFCGEGPGPSCDTPARIQQPTCKVLNCAEHPFLLTLADGTQLRPHGSEWDNFCAGLGTTMPDQVLISYRPEATQAIYTWSNATITCISAVAE